MEAISSTVAEQLTRALGQAVVRLWSSLPQMSDWFERVKQRPSYAATFYPGARISEKYAAYFRSANDWRAERGY